METLKKDLAAGDLDQAGITAMFVGIEWAADDVDPLTAIFLVSKFPVVGRKIFIDFDGAQLEILGSSRTRFLLLALAF